MTVETASTSNPNELEGLKMDTVVIYGLSRVPKGVSHGEISYSDSTKVATIANLDRPMMSDWQISISF